MSEPKKHQKPSLLLRGLAVLGTTLGILCLFVYAGVNIICKGPSPTARDLFVGSVMETSAAKFLAYLCYSEEEIAEIRARNAVVETAEVTEQTGFAQRDESVPRTPSSWWMSPAPPSRARCSLSMIPPGSKSPWLRSFPRRPRASGWRTSPNRKMPWLPSTAAVHG